MEKENKENTDFVISFYDKHNDEHLYYKSYQDFLDDLKEMFEQNSGKEQFAIDLCLLSEVEE